MSEPSDRGVPQDPAEQNTTEFPIAMPYPHRPEDAYPISEQPVDTARFGTYYGTGPQASGPRPGEVWAGYGTAPAQGANGPGATPPVAAAPFTQSPVAQSPVAPVSVAPMAVAPAARRPSPLWIGLAVLVVVALVVGGIVLFTRSNGSGSPSADPRKTSAGTTGRTLRLPSSVSGLHRTTGVDASTLRTALAAGGPGASDPVVRAVLEHGQFGVYSRGDFVGGAGLPALAFFAAPVADVPGLSSGVTGAALTAVLNRLMAAIPGTGSAGSPTSVSPGALGGVMSCAHTSVLTRTIRICSWADGSYAALTLLTDASDDAAAAQTTRAFRAAAEH